MVKGVAPPRAREGVPFHYLELGSGMGFGLCLMAALYPEGLFTGVDFQPEHIAHSQQLVALLGLDNVRFLDADFLALEQDSSPLGFSRGESGCYHYVVAHGIATWVVEPVQRALLSLAAAALRPGGIFYCSYNCFPGCLSRSVLQQLVWLEIERSDPALPGEALERAFGQLAGLLGRDQQPTPLARLMPSLGQELQAMQPESMHYLLGEFANQGWQPLYVAEMQRRCADHKLRPIATATLPELFEELLPQQLRDLLVREPNPVLRETLIDLACMRSFRRDLYCRGSMRLSGEEWQQRLEDLRLRRCETPSRQTWTFSTSFGELSVPAEVCEALEEALADGPWRLGDLARAIDQPAVEVVRLTGLLMHQQRLGLDRGEAGQRAGSVCDRVNERVLQRISLGWPYTHLAAPRVGNGVNIHAIEALCCLAPGRGPLSKTDIRHLLAKFNGRGKIAQEARDHQPSSDEDVEDVVLDLVEIFQSRRVPLFRELGVSLARFHSRSSAHADLP